MVTRPSDQTFTDQAPVVKKQFPAMLVTRPTDQTDTNQAPDTDQAPVFTEAVSVYLIDQTD